MQAIIGRAAERPLEILMVEDNAADVRLFTELWKESELPHRLSVVRNGEEGMAFLRREGIFAGAPRPDLVLLDLNLPRRDGRTLLAEIKQDPVLRRLPIIVLTTSNAESDILQCYDLHANCYIVKPVGIEPLAQVMRLIRDFWFSLASLPPAAR